MQVAGDKSTGARLAGTFELEDVSKRFGRTVAVRNLSLRVEPGKTTILIGPSGCGKSTLLRLMIGLLAPDQGEVRFDGEPVGPESVLAMRRRMGYVVQTGGLFPHLTARANVRLLARHLRLGEAAMQTRVAELTRLMRLPAELLERYPAQLSGGQCQRISLMRALMLDPEVLLLDEPLGSLDPMVRSELQEDLRELFRDLGKTVVMVTHDLGEARYLGERIVLVHNGEIVQDGSPADLVRRPASPFVTEFVNAQRYAGEPQHGEQG